MRVEGRGGGVRDGSEGPRGDGIGQSWGQFRFYIKT